MVTIDNQEILAAVIKDSLITVEQNEAIDTNGKFRWQRAIAKAAVKLETRGEFITWQPEKETLLIWSDSNEIYEANGVCQCIAFQKEQPCWHRAAKRLYELYVLELDQLELNREARRREMDAAIPLLPPTLKGSLETVAGVRV